MIRAFDISGEEIDCAMDDGDYTVDDTKTDEAQIERVQNGQI